MREIEIKGVNGAGFAKSHVMNLWYAVFFLFGGAAFAANLPTLTRVEAKENCPRALERLPDFVKTEYVTYLFAAPPEFDPEDSAQVDEALAFLTPSVFTQGETPLIIWPARFTATLFKRRLDAKLQELRRQEAMRFAPIEISVTIEGPSTTDLSQFFAKPRGLR